MHWRNILTGVLWLVVAVAVSVMALFVLARPCPAGAITSGPAPLKPGSVLTDAEFEKRHAGPEYSLDTCKQWMADTPLSQRLRIDLAWYFGFAAPILLLFGGLLHRRSTWHEPLTLGALALIMMLALGAHLYGLMLLVATTSVLFVIKKVHRAAAA